MTERFLKRQIVRYLHTIPLSYWEVSPAGSTSGKPDITGCIRGRYCAIEVKTQTGRLSKIQAYKIEGLKNSGAVAFVARDLESVIAGLKAHGLL